MYIVHCMYYRRTYFVQRTRGRHEVTTESTGLCFAYVYSVHALPVLECRLPTSEISLVRQSRERQGRCSSSISQSLPVSKPAFLSGTLWLRNAKADMSTLICLGWTFEPPTWTVSPHGHAESGLAPKAKSSSSWHVWPSCHSRSPIMRYN